jgi:hypothetical protein
MFIAFFVYMVRPHGAFFNECRVFANIPFLQKILFLPDFFWGEKGFANIPFVYRQADLFLYILTESFEHENGD